MSQDPRTARLAEFAGDLGELLERADPLNPESPIRGHFGCDGRYQMPAKRIRGTLKIRA